MSWTNEYRSVKLKPSMIAFMRVASLGTLYPAWARPAVKGRPFRVFFRGFFWQKPGPAFVDNPEKK